MAKGELTNLKAENSKAVFGLNVIGKSENPIHVSQTRNYHSRNFNGLHNIMFHNKVKAIQPNVRDIYFNPLTHCYDKQISFGLYVT